MCLSGEGRQDKFVQSSRYVLKPHYYKQSFFVNYISVSIFYKILQVTDFVPVFFGDFGYICGIIHNFYFLHLQFVFNIVVLKFYRKNFVNLNV